MIRKIFSITSKIAERLPFGRVQAMFFLFLRAANECRFAINGYLSTLLEEETQSDEYFSRRQELIRSKESAIFDKQKPCCVGYVIVAHNYTRQSAGIYCLYRLCHDLNMLNIPAYITGSNYTPSQLLAPLISMTDAKRLAKKGFIAIYPEIVCGNPLRAKKVARWVLNKPGLLGGKSEFANTEKVFYYSSLYRASIKNEVVGQLYLPTIDEAIFYDDNRPVTQRSLECYYIGKSKWVDGHIDKSNLFEINRRYPKRDDLGKLLRASKTLYCFDNTTILAAEAVLCGCRVVLIPDGSQTRTDYENSELGMNGITWGLQGSFNAHSSSVTLSTRYQELKDKYKEQLRYFINETQKSIW